ncbi:glycosyltransferase family 2 protein [Candidatus Formimonas warabiya]|uniref:Glycosyltransferase n=1 Tax=Formimonas warabiya TaxID=1761012 RepID=A0A3G1KZ90_FORW1|nr:glycosyltransferase family 2 protein [Candidatus Formimonas warabiya]ATW27720.1 glycosyltransferase [Candidatus Formimonas warabiya]
MNSVNCISLVIPLLNEQDSIKILYNKLTSILKVIDKAYEIIFVDDGSNDNSPEIIREICRQDINVKLIRFRRNFGKATALSSGFEIAKGDVIITMDADLQDEPNEIPKMLAKLTEGFDLVSGWKLIRNDPISKTLPSKLFNKTVSFVSGLELHDFNCGFKAYRREIIKNIQLYGEMHRYIPALAHNMGFKVGEIPVKHNARQFGKSKYGFNRFLRGLFDCLTVLFLTKYVKRPLHFFGKFGLISGFVGAVICIYLTIIKILGEKIGNRPLLNLGILLIILGAQFFSTGLIAEMITLNNHKKYNKNNQVQILEIININDSRLQNAVN